ncbi:putative NUDIX family NTP pyrophosphohydrolase [Pseudorhizobium tarimense]|uniref:NUDIX family NTP pyrophosphohydrolase n=1 Tax=Pseudorhizobium tarimense TaxID=1079109 RepID=A0ABV2H7M1_9HYPH|nr:NUDIX domain-containing protein [Pseudorhizobium tarimense]MCJ8519621.1 NUDIX domain-containing protein [Pseudorhizobium tarimense]
MVKQSAGLAIFRRGGDGIEVLLCHPGGPFWSRKDAGAWTIPKGLVDAGEDPLLAARREAHEELGTDVSGDFHWLGEYRQPGGKLVLVWAVEPQQPIDASAIVSNTFELEWPPRSGRKQSFPEIDQAEWFALEQARTKILKGQVPMLVDLEALAADEL